MKWLSLLTTLFFVSGYAQNSKDTMNYNASSIADVRRLIAGQFNRVDSIFHLWASSDTDDSSSANVDPATESYKIFDIIQANTGIIVNDTSFALKGLVNIVTSKNRQLYVLSWNTKLGGTLIDFASVILYRSGSNVFYKRLIDSSDSYIDNPKIYFNNIYSFKTNSNTLYVAQGVGQGSGLLPWQKIMAFEIMTDSLLQPPVFPKSKNEIFIEFDRSHLKDPYDIPRIRINEAAKIIRVPMTTEHYGFNGKYTTLKFDGSKFVPNR